MATQPPPITESEARAHVERFIEVLRSDAPRWLDNRIADWERARVEFRKSGYGAVIRPPRHPLIEALGYFREWSPGTECAPPVLELIESASAVNAFEKDWRGSERWLVQRLRDEKGCRQTLFELRVALYWQYIGHAVTYLSPNQLPGPDLRVTHAGLDVFLECVQMDPNAGHRVRRDTAEEIGRRLIRHMRRTGQNRVVMLRCSERLEPGDTHTIGAAMEQLIASSTGAFPLLEGKYRVELGYGGSEVAPLDWTGALTAWSTLKSVPIGFGEIHGLDDGVRPPFGRYIARGLTVVSDEMDDAIKRLIDAAIAKGTQLPREAPGIVVAEFGMPLTEEQARWDRLHLALAHNVRTRLANHPEISAIAFMFPIMARRTSVASGVGAIVTPTDIVHWFANEHAAMPLPDGFNWRVEPAELIRSSAAE